MCDYKRPPNGFKEQIVERADELKRLTPEQERQEAQVVLFLDTVSNTLGKYKDRSKWFWYRVIIIEWLRQKTEAIGQFLRRVFTKGVGQ